MAVKPFSPQEAWSSKFSAIPDEVIEAVNELLSTRWRGKGAVTIHQKDIAELAQEKLVAAGCPNPDDLYKNHWMDFEPLFEKQGWKVVYDKPAYCENYEPYFEFSKKEP